MPPGKKQQSNAMLYTLIAFVGLFIIAATIAVIFYVKSEEHRKNADTFQSQINELATSGEQRRLGEVVGTKQGRASWLGTMTAYLDQAISVITGGVANPTSAEVKVNESKLKSQEVSDTVREYIEVGDIGETGLIRVIEQLKIKMDNMIKAKESLQEQFRQLQQRYDDDMKASFEKEKELLAEKDRFEQLVGKIEKDYKELEELLRKNTDEQVQTLRSELMEDRENLKITKQELLKTQAELEMAQERMKKALEKVQEVKPLPDTEVAAFKPDGEIILVDDQAKAVHLNIGSNNHVYRGLTFSVYHRNASIARDGKGKAEVEVFDVAKNYSSARILRSEINSPILEGDIIANLIWDSSKVNAFVIAGEFDLDDDGGIEYDAIGKIRALIKKWGGSVADTISIDTDFVVLGRPPVVLRKPSQEELEIDPAAMQKYNDSVRRYDRYKDVQSRAQTLWIPIFNYERFLYFIGYKEYSTTAGAF